jgi:DNA repair exonuclease SbcCD ATPase subunit
MDYEIQKINYNKTIKKIYHLSDIHIHLQSKHNEYKIVFERVFNYIKEIKDEYSVIIITGDILHSKTELLPECIELTRSFLIELSKLLPTIIIAGNHDLNINNEERLDGLTPIVNGVPKDLPLYYFSKSGLYYFSNIIFSVVSVRDYLIIDPEEILNCHNKIKICLYHGRVNGAELFNKSLIDGEINKKTNKTITKESFNGYDYVLMGDIHKKQFIKPNMAYSGSLIQQNHGETIEHHGILIWDLVKNEHTFKEIVNDYCYFTYQIKDNELSLERLKQLHIPKNIRLRLLLTNTLNSKIQEFIAIFKQYYNVLEVSYQEYSKSDNNDIKKEITLNITNVDYQNKLIEEILIKNPNITTNTINKIKQLNKFSNETLEENEMMLNSRWKLIKLEFSNLFSYSENNVIDFRKTKGVFGIIAPNHMGKSAIIDIILYTLFDKFPRKGNVKDIINNRKNSFTTKITIKIGSWKYIICKTGKKTSKNKVTTTLSFYRINKQNIKQLLDEDSISFTKKNILKYIGGYEDIIQTNISLQNNNCNFIEAENTARKKELERILQVNFIEDLVKRGNTILMEKNAIYKHLQSNCYEESILKLNGEIKTLIKNITVLNNNELELNKKIEIIEKNINNFTIHCNINIDEELNILNDKLKTDNPKKQLEENNSKLNSLKNKLTTNKLSIYSYQELFEMKTKYENKNDIFNQNKVKKINKLDQKLEKLNSKIKKLNYDNILHNTELLKTTNKLDTILKLKNKYNDIKSNIEVLNSEKEKLQLKIDKNNSSLKELNLQSMPDEMIEYLEERLVDDMKEQLDLFKKNKKIRNIVDLSKELGIYEYLEEYVTEQENNSKTIELNLKKEKDFLVKKNTLVKKIELLHKELNTISYNQKTELDILNRINKLEEDIKVNSENKKYEIEIDEMKLDKNNLFKIKNKEYIEFILLYDENEKNTRIKTEIETLEISTNYLKENIEKYDDMILRKKENDKIIRKIEELKELKNSKKEELKKIEYEMNVNKTKFTSSHTQLATHKKEIEKMLILEKEKNLYSLYVKVLKDIPFILINKIIPTFEKKINSLLSVSTNFMVKIIVENNKIELYLDRPVYNGSLILLNNASGFERFISSLAIRLGLLHISQLPKPNFIAIDEGWTSFDYNNINNVRNIFDILKGEFDFILSISHLSQIREHCDSQLHLKKNSNGYSEIIK